VAGTLKALHWSTITQAVATFTRGVIGTKPNIQ
jgi:hypothetical protein